MTATITSAGLACTVGGNISRSAMTTRMRSSPARSRTPAPLAQEHAHQVVVPAAAPEAAPQVGTTISMMAPV
jgi:hypothetical protein